MSFSVIIPARFASTRLPGKMLLEIAGKPMLAHVVDRANESQASRVIVATDDDRIAEAMSGENCDVCLTRADHESGSDRLAEVVETLNLPDEHVVVNVQGDEPMIPGALINQVAESLSRNSHAAMATAAKAIVSETDFVNPNVVKVVFNQRGEALYFSRSPIPCHRDDGFGLGWHHIGIYAYRSEFLKRYHALSASKLEQYEKLEQLRVLDHGEKIMVEVVDEDNGVGVDTLEDLQRVRELFSKQESASC